MSASQSSTVVCNMQNTKNGMQNGSHGEKEKIRESKAKDTMVETEGYTLSRSV